MSLPDISHSMAQAGTGVAAALTQRRAPSLLQACDELLRSTSTSHMHPTLCSYQRRRQLMWIYQADVT
jgi:hypothetical protein